MQITTVIYRKLITYIGVTCDYKSFEVSKCYIINTKCCIELYIHVLLHKCTRNNNMFIEGQQQFSMRPSCKGYLRYFVISDPTKRWDGTFRMISLNTRNKKTNQACMWVLATLSPRDLKHGNESFEETKLQFFFTIMYL